MLPITVIVLLLTLTIAPVPFYTLALFLVGSLMLILGMALFTLGADLSMMVMGEKMGAHLTRSRKLPLIIIATFIIGMFITIAEPDLKVLAKQTPAVPDTFLILAVAIGVGIFLVVSFLRIFYRIKLSYLLIGLYIFVFILAAFTHENFLAVAFDSGGVTTGPITVPFIMALGIGLAYVRGDKTAAEDSFGLVGLCSIGPIMTVLILGIFYQSSSGNYSSISTPEAESLSEVFTAFLHALPDYSHEVLIALLPILVFFIIFQIFALRLKRLTLLRLGVGMVYTFLGLVLFLTGVSVGFMPVGYLVGIQIVEKSFGFLLIPLGIIIGYFIVAAEPAVHVLKEQVENITDGNITGRAMGLSLSIGVGISVGLAMLRVLTGISIWYLILPGYILALALTFFTPPLFTSIAFDSGGVASGPMTATFLLPFAMGATKAIGGNIQTDAFGIVAMVAMTPLITIQCLGIIYRIKSKKHNKEQVSPVLEDFILDYSSSPVDAMIETSGLPYTTVLEYNQDNTAVNQNNSLQEDSYGQPTSEL